MAKRNLNAELAARAVQRLEELRSSDSAYPAPLDALLLEVAPDLPSASQAAVARHANFRSRTVRGHGTRLDTPVALTDDVDRLAASSQLFEFACRAAGAVGPPWNAADLLKAVAAPLRPAFQAELKRLGQSGEQRIAFSNDEWIALRLVAALQQQGATSGSEFPELAELAQRAGFHPQRDQAKLKRVVASPTFKQQAVVLRDKTLETPVAPADRVAELVRHPETLTKLVTAVRTAKKSLVTLTELLKKASTPVRPLLSQAVSEQISRGELSENLGAIREGGAYKFFLLDDLEPASLRRRARSSSATDSTRMAESHAGEQASKPSDFATRFVETFSRLDAEQGSYNQVSLRALRENLSAWGREEFDAELQKLRVAGEFVLSGLQSRGGISPEDQAAGIREAGVLRVYVSRKR